jgi:hypothetical protein
MLITIGCLLWAGLAMGQADTGSDGIGFYADLAGYQNAATTDILVPLQFYLLHTKCSVPAGTAAWECTASWTGNLVILGWNLAGIGPINVAQPPEFEVGLGIPTPWSPAILLMDVWCMVLDPEPCYFYLTGGPLDSLNNGLPVFAAGDDVYDLRNMYPSSGNRDLPVFCINGDAPIPTESMAWTEVKELYRE